MLGKVIAPLLNVRSRPDKQGKKIGLLSRDAIVRILGERENWFEINYQGISAFAYGDYIRPIKRTSVLKARVTATKLNVRQAPSITAPILGRLVQTTLVNVVGEHPGWIEIEFNQGSGFVDQRYVELIEGGTPRSGIVNVPLANVRAAPTTHSDALGTIAEGTDVQILSQVGNWYEIRFNGVVGYMRCDLLQTQTLDDERVPPPISEIAPDDDASVFLTMPLAPMTKYEPGGTAERQKAALTWNKFGGLLEALAYHHKIDTACAVAVLCVESAGKGFEQNNGNRMVIRFENHKFWEYWGKRHPEKFKTHFRYNPDEPWLGHQWRSLPTDHWENFHGSQVNEWQVLEFARELDDTAALQSISMGAPQIMGFHYARIGFVSVQAMFEKFGSDIRHQIIGFFDFLNASSGMIAALQKKDFVKFAGLYNGSGQKEKYGAWIDDHYQAFKKLTAI